MKQNDRNKADGHYYTLAHFLTFNVKEAIQRSATGRQFGSFGSLFLQLSVGLFFIMKAEFQLPAPVAVMTQQIQIHRIQ